ncbi:MAG: hypothetical protein K8R56_10120 [Candidatus Eisenbacteria bacterium]|nr:hypothetical protein [Candidatus Eisenbacteria bacterium]
MKKVLLLCGMLLAVTASIAAAAPGTNLRWTNCFGDAGAINRTFACTSNTGSNILVGSFELGADILTASGLEVVIDLASSGASLPAWWQFKNAGTCRTTSLSANFTIPGTAAVCQDWAAAQSSGGIGAYDIGGAAGANTARVKMAIAVPPSALVDLFAATEYFGYNLAINNAKTVGTGACAGCATPVCIVFNSVKVTTPIAANDRVISGATNGTDSNYATWQGGAGASSIRGTGCPQATPTRNATWGSVKSLYR